jgi:hypothetical protein
MNARPGPRLASRDRNVFPPPRSFRSFLACSCVFLALAAVASGMACAGQTSNPCVEVEITPADRACSSDSDCTATTPGLVCAGAGFCSCDIAPVNQTALNAFLQEGDQVGAHLCNCPLVNERAACVSGQCWLVPVGDGGEDAAPDGGAVEVVAGNVQLDGVTDDGLIIYEGVDETVWAVPFDGGAPKAIASPGFETPGVTGYYWGGASVFHHVVVMSVVGAQLDPTGATTGGPVATWDERTGVTTIFTPPLQEGYGTPGSTVSPDSQFIAITWPTEKGYGPTYSVSRVDGSDSVSIGGASTVTFDQDSLLYTIAGDAGTSLVALDGANGWSSVTLATSEASYVADEVGARVLVVSGSDSDGGQELLLAPLDGGAPTVIDPTGGGPALYLSPDSTFAIYTAAAGTASAHVEAVTLPLSGPPGTPYAVTASALSLEALVAFTKEPFQVAPAAPAGPVAFFAMTSPAAPGDLVAIVGAGAGATAPNLTVPGSVPDGFTSEQSCALITRPSGGQLLTGTLTAYPLPDGPESAPLSTSSFGWTALGGTTVLFTDNYSPSVTTDLRIADVAKGTSSTLVASDVNALRYVVSPDRTRIAYTRLNEGLWVTALPSGL